MKDLFSLDGKRFLITGGTRGLGRAISLQFARAGAVVLANYVREQESATSLQELAKSEGLAITCVRADLTSSKGIDTLVQAATDVPTLSGVVHCAATGVHRPFDQLTTRHFDWTLALNVRALFELIQRLLPSLKEGSSILGISSHGSLRAVPQYTLVGTSKAALEAMLRHLAFELAPRGIRVNTLLPGTLMTDAWKAMPESESRIQDSKQRSALGRLCTLEEVARVAQFLCSDASSGVVAQTVVVDAGAATAV